MNEGVASLWSSDSSVIPPDSGSSLVSSEMRPYVEELLFGQIKDLFNSQEEARAVAREEERAIYCRAKNKVLLR